jgi:peptidoglycan-associated lipoprotein
MVMSKWYAVPFVAGLLFLPGRLAHATSCPDVRIHFETDKSEIPSEDKAYLDRAASCLKQNERLHVILEGRADKRGTQAYNQALSERRAEAVEAYLTAQGVSAAQLSTVGFGKDRPVCASSDAECLARNRQTAIRATCHL